MININHLLKNDLNLLICLYVLLEEKNVSKAAKRLHLSQSAVSKQLTRLRSLYDDPLFERESKGLFPTPKALSLAPELHLVLQQIENLTKPDTFDPEISQRVFHFDLVETAYQAIYPSFMPNVLSSAPHITINSQNWGEGSFKRLLKRDIDFGISIFEWDERSKIHVKTIPNELHYAELKKDFSACIMHKDHPALNEEWNIDTFLKYRHIQVVVGGVQEWLLHEILEIHSLAINHAVNVSDINSAIKLCAQSDLLLCYPYALLKEFYDPTQFIIKPLPIDLKAGAHFLLWHKQFDNDLAHRWLRNQITQANFDEHS
ncbi:LysR family transcriptional regulator [Vibrio sp.]|nr:LysR family transcriptional regulator [Vibrio sp.]